MRYITSLALDGQNAASSNTSQVYDASQLLQASAHIICSATATGVVKFQASNDYGNNMSGAVPTNWVDIPSITQTLSGGTAYLIPKFDLCYQWIRIAYTAGGTGTVTVKMKAHGV